MASAPPEPTPEERRAWRLALLLTGDAAGADRVLMRVLQAQPDLDEVPPARRDRLVVLRAREDAPGAGPAVGLVERVRAAHLQRRGAEPVATERTVFEGPANALLQLSLRLPSQQHEALMLHRIEGLELRDMARAMDCSTTAGARHLDEAERAMAETMGRDYIDASQLLRRQAQEAAPGDAPIRMRMAMLRRRRWKTVALALATVIALGACAIGVWLLWPRGSGP